jgi:hypothetical protein
VVQELSELAADAGQHLQESGFGLAALGAKELHHPQELLAQENREAKAAVEVFFGGNRREGKLVSVRVFGIQAGAALAQTRPGKPTPRANILC